MIKTDITSSSTNEHHVLFLMVLRMTQYYVVFLPKMYKLNLVTRKHQNTQVGMKIIQDKEVKQQPSISMVAAITLACNTSKDFAHKKLME